MESAQVTSLVSQAEGNLQHSVHDPELDMGVHILSGAWASNIAPLVTDFWAQGSPSPPAMVQDCVNSFLNALTAAHITSSGQLCAYDLQP